MKAIATKLPRTAKFLSKVREVFNAPMRIFTTFMLSLYSTAMVTVPTLCVKLKADNVDMDTLFGSMADIIIKLAFYVGILITVGAIFSLVFAYKDDNGATRSAVKSCSV